MNHFLTKTALTLLLGAVLGGVLAAPSVMAQTANSTAAVDCKAPTTQRQMNDCAYDDFLVANAGYAESNKSVVSKLAGKQAGLFRRAQTTWIAYRTAACAFESSAVQGGSAQGMVNWQCAARITRARAAELATLGNCTEGDLACVRFDK